MTRVNQNVIRWFVVLNMGGANTKKSLSASFHKLKPNRETVQKPHKSLFSESCTEWAEFSHCFILGVETVASIHFEPLFRLVIREARTRHGNRVGMSQPFRSSHHCYLQKRTEWVRAITVSLQISHIGNRTARSLTCKWGVKWPVVALLWAASHGHTTHWECQDTL